VFRYSGRDRATPRREGFEISPTRMAEGAKEFGQIILVPLFCWRFRAPPTPIRDPGERFTLKTEPYRPLLALSFCSTQVRVRSLLVRRKP